MAERTPGTDSSTTPVVVVTGANGFVGSHVCAALLERGAQVRAVVRRSGAAPDLPGVEEWVGEFYEPAFAATVVDGAYGVVTTVHPMGSSRENQHRIGVEGTPVLGRAARDAGVDRFVHVSTASVYDRSPGVGDVDEDAPLVGDDADDYSVTKRDTDEELCRIDGPTRILVRPPAILGPGTSSIWNTVRPQQMRDDPEELRAVAQRSFAWVHVDDLVALLADAATGRLKTAAEPSLGPVEGGCTAVNVAGQPAVIRDYLGTVAVALGLEPVWEDGPAWTGRILAERAAGWGWRPGVSLQEALAELAAGLSG